MEPNDEVTPVLFRNDDGEITAVFPTIEEGPGLWACYAHLGQHSACTRGWYQTTKPAKPDEFARLQTELEQIGYRLKVLRRWPSRA